MPNRILREGINGSERIALLKWPDEVFYRRLMSVVDDYGRTDANPQLLRSRCYPLQTDAVRNTDISRWLAACETAGLILVYTVRGKQFLQMLDFRQQLRSPSKFPEPEADPQPKPADVSTDTTDASISAADAHLCVSVSGFVSEGVCEIPPNPQGGEAGQPAAFDRFWEAYPLKVGKGKARDVFTRKKVAPIVDDLLAAIGRQKVSADWTKDGGQYIPHPSTWLNQERWQDEGRAPFSGRKRYYASN